jgi:ubiquinone/menaquinone biosynthesis C-methylase UbiE
VLAEAVYLNLTGSLRRQMPVMDANEALFDHWDEIYPHQELVDTLRSLRVDVIEAFGGRDEIRVHDLCCAQGRALEVFRSVANVRLIGLDHSERMLTTGRQRIPEASFVLGDVRCPPELFAGQSFHCITITSGSIQFFGRTHRANIFKAARSLLVDGGMFIVDVFKSGPDSHEDRAWVRKWIRTGDCSTIVVFCRECRGGDGRIQRVYVIDDRANGHVEIASGFAEYFDVSRTQLIEELQPHFSAVASLDTAYAGTEFVVARTT